MIQENFYVTNNQGTRTGPLSSQEIGELVRRNLLHPQSVVTDSEGVLQTDLERFSEEFDPDHRPPPSLPQIEEEKVSVASEGIRLLRRTILIVLAISTVRFIFWLFSRKAPPHSDGNSSSRPPKWTPSPLRFDQIPRERFYPRETQDGEGP